jgi:hypothetical protein
MLQYNYLRQLESAIESDGQGAFHYWLWNSTVQFERRDRGSINEAAYKQSENRVL